MKQVAISSVALAGILSTLCMLGTGGCAMSHDVGGDATPQLLPIKLDAQCQKELEDSPYGLPDHLSCTGLYQDTAKREVAKGVMPYTPALSLWADGMNKARFVYLPKGTKIDAADPNAWQFPIGARLWKEFQAPGTDIPVETRLYYKRDEGDWQQSAYEWNDARTEATRVLQAKDVTMPGGQKHWLPGPDDCDKCHKGRRDRVLGFEQVALGLPGADGATLAKLAEQGLLKNLDSVPQYQIGPDESSGEARALGWLHMNCGVTCHNDNPNRSAVSVNMRLRLQAEDLDGRPTQSFPAVVTTVGVDTQTLRWLGKTRVVAGSPKDSWLYTLITQRGNLKEQMPPLATYLVDPNGSDWVRQWIEGLKAP